MSDYSKYLKNALSKKGMKQKELSEKTGLTEVTISRYMSGERVPNIQNLKKIIDVLDIDVNDMFGLKKMTNADRIRTMTDEQLAEFLSEYECNQCNFCTRTDTFCYGTDCTKYVIEWLQSEAKESEEE